MANNLLRTTSSSSRWLCLFFATPFSSEELAFLRGPASSLTSICLSWLIALGVGIGCAGLFAAEPKSNSDKSKEPQREIFSGKVVLAQEALKKRGIKVADEMKSQAVLELESGELLPIAADWRGRAFYQDEQLRNRKVELVGYRRPGIPYLQVLNVFTFNDKNERQDTDYWCDICSIPMYEIKECECCQGPIRLRFRPGKLPSYAVPTK